MATDPQEPNHHQLLSHSRSTLLSLSATQVVHQVIMAVPGGVAQKSFDRLGVAKAEKEIELVK